MPKYEILIIANVYFITYQADSGTRNLEVWAEMISEPEHRFDLLMV